VSGGLLLVVLCALAVIGPFSMDVYTPALPALRATFGTDVAVAQATVTVCLVGIAVGQLFLGPLSDSVGRRPVLVAGTIGWTLGSAACALAPDLGVFFAGRVVEGVCGGAGIVVTRAVVSDRSTAVSLARDLSLLSAMATVFPVLAPIIGGYVAELGGWRADFTFLVGVGVVLSLAVFFVVPETRSPSARTSGGPVATLRGMAAVARRPGVTRSVVTIAGAGFAFFAYVASSTFVLQETLGVSRSLYVLVFATNAAGAFTASMTFRRCAHVVPVRGVAVVGAIAMTLGALTVLVAVLAGGALAGVWVGLALFTTGWGALLPANNGLAQASGRDRAGATSALTGSRQYVAGAAGAPIVGLFSGGGMLPFAAVLLAGSAFSVVAVVWPGRRPGVSS